MELSNNELIEIKEFLNTHLNLTFYNHLNGLI